MLDQVLDLPAILIAHLAKAEYCGEPIEASDTRLDDNVLLFHEDRKLTYKPGVRTLANDGHDSIRLWILPKLYRPHAE